MIVTNAATLPCGDLWNRVNAGDKTSAWEAETEGSGAIETEDGKEW